MKDIIMALVWTSITPRYCHSCMSSPTLEGGHALNVVSVEVKPRLKTPWTTTLLQSNHNWIRFQTSSRTHSSALIELTDNVTRKPSYSQVLQSSTTTSLSNAIDPNVRTAMLSAVHTEFRDISNRSLNVVVSGLKPSNNERCGSIFWALCIRFDHISYCQINSSTR